MLLREEPLVHGKDAGIIAAAGAEIRCAGFDVGLISVVAQQRLDEGGGGGVAALIGEHHGFAEARLPAIGSKRLCAAVEIESEIVTVEIAGGAGSRFGDASVVLRCLVAGIEVEDIRVVAGPAGDDGGVGEETRIVGIGLEESAQDEQSAWRISGARLGDGGFAHGAGRDARLSVGR